MTAPMVAKALGRSLNWFYRHREQLEREHGFPKTVRGCGTRWDPRALDTWLDQQLPTATSPEAQAEDLLIRRASVSVA